MLEIKPFDAWAEANATTDPSEKLRQYADYVRTNAYKNGQLDDATNQEIEQGIVDRARVDGLISDEEPEENRNKKLQGLLTPIQNKDADAKFLLDHYRNDFAENSPEFLEKAPTIQQYLSLKQVSPDKVGELQGLVDGYIESKSDVKNARLSAVDRGDYRVVAIDEEGGRQLYTGADTKPDNLNGELDTLISNGAISATDLNDVRKLTMPINGGQATVAEGTRYNVFANTISSLSKKDPTLRSSIDQEAAKIRESKRAEQLTTGETVFDYVKKAVAVPLDFVGGLVTEAFGLSHPEEPVAPPSELIGGNRAITERFSSGEVNQFLGDYMKHASGPFYRADKPETGLDTDSLGNVIVSPALIGNKAQFEQALKSAPLNDDQKERATIQRMAMLETEAPKILNLILGESNEAVSAYAVARAAGKAPSEFIEEWVGNNSQNYDGMSERLQQLGMSTFSAIATLPVGIGALMGIEPAAKALVAMNKEQSDREEYSRLFGDEFGLTFQLVNTIPQVATDIFATIGTGALYTGAKAIAKGGSKAIMREATRAAVSSVDDVAAASVRSASAVGGEALVGEALEKVGGSLATNLAKADKLVPLFATSFTRSAASTYGSIYGQLPDSMSADEKHRNAFGYAVASGISTAVITSGMSFLGQGGLEDLATGKFRPITAVDDSVTGMRKVSLNELTYKQAKFLNDNLTNAGAKLTDKAFQKTLTANIGGAYKNYIRTTLRGAIDEGFEESIDQAIQNRIEDAATDKNTPLAERVNQIWTAFTLGGILGGASPAVGQLVKPLNISDVTLALDARVSVLSKVASDLRKTGSTATAEVLQRQLNDAQAAANTQRQTEIAAQQQKEVQAKTEEVITQADKPLTFEPTGQAELALGDTRSNTLPQTTRFLTDFDGERAYLGSYAGTLETNGDSVRLILDEPRADGVSHLVVGNRFQPIDKSGIRLDRKRLMLTGEHSLNIPAGTPYVIPDPRKKFKFALPTDPANVSFVQDMANAPVLRIENARVIGQENVSSPIILTDKGQIEDALRYYNLDPAVLMQPENVGQLELDLLEDTPVVEVATTPVANPAAVVETPVVKKSRKKKGAASTVVEEPPVVVDPTTIDPAEVIADAIETGDTPPPKAYSEEQEYVRDIVMDNQLTAALLSVKENGFTPEEINKVANGFAPEVFIDLKIRIDKATEYAMGLDDSLADVRSNILSNLTSLVAIYKRVEVAQFIQAKPAVVAEAAPVVAEPAAVVAPERDVEEPAPAPIVAPTPIAETPSTKKTTTKKQPVTPLPDTTVVSDEENPSEDAIDLKEELTDLNTTVPVFDVDGQPTTLESLEVQFQQLDNRIQAAKESQTPIPSGVLDAYKSLRSTVNVARFAVEGKATEIKAKIKELTAPDPEVDIRTDAQKNADELLSIMKGEKQVSPEVAAAAAAVQPTPSKFKEAKGVGPVGFKGEAQPIVVFRDGVFRNAEEANIYANWVAGGFPISNLAEHGFDPRQVSGINFQSHSTEIKQRLWKDIQERFPFIPVPTGTLTTKSKRRVPYMTKAGDNYIDIPYEADSNGKPVRGVFTNNPLVTAQQIDLGLMIIIPKSVATSKGFSRNLSIDVKDTGKGSFVVTSVKRHPFDTGVFVAGDISLVGKSGTVPKKAMTNLGGILRPPAPQFLEGAGPSARNQDNNTFETYMNDMMSVSRSDFLRKDGTSRISPFGAFDKLITKTFGLTEQGGLNAMSVAQVSYANNLKEYALAKKIQSALTKAQIKKPNTTVIDLNLSKIILEEMVSQGQNAPKPNDVANAIKKIYGLSGGSADGIISNYGQYLYDNITSGEFSLGVKPFRTHVRNAAKSQQVRESRRGEKSRGSSATTQLEYERILDSLVDVDTDVFEDVARSVDASTLKQLANTLRVNTKAYDSLFKVVQKSYPDISEDMDEEELIDTAGEILRNYSKEEHVILARDLNRSVDGINLANALIDVGWLPPVGSEIITPRQTEGTTAQVEPLPQRATPAQKKQRILDAKALARATIGVQFSQADGRMLADEARKVNNAEIKRLGIVSNDPESVIAALRDLQESGTPMQRLVAGVLTANVDLIRNVRFAIGDMNDVRFAGAFMPKSNLVVVNIAGHNGRGIVDVLLHEYLHAVTVQTMTNPKTPAQVAAMQRIASLRALTAAQAEKMGLDTEGFESALSDDLEFVTVALTDPEFQTLVRAATPTAQRSLLSRIWESLRSLFGYASTDKKMADAFDELLDFTQMFAGANTFNIKSERNLRLEAHKIREGLSALREFASVKGRLRSNAEVLYASRRSILDDMDAELQSEIYGGSAARDRRIRESVAYTGASSKSGELRSQEIDGYDGPELPTASGWLSPKGKFFALDPSDTGLSAGFGTHQQRLLDILVNEHSEAELDEVLLGLGFDNIYDLSENEVYLIGYELGYARILDSGDEIYVEKWHSNRDIPTPKALTPPQILALKKAGKLEEKTVMRDGVPTPLYIPPQYDYTSFSLGSEASGEVAIDVVSEFESQLPEGMSLNVDSNFKGEAGIRRSQPNVIYVNPELLSNRVAGLSEDAARAAIRGLANHEVAHFAALSAFTQDHIARVATELGEDQLQKIAEQYYSTAGLTAEETLANIKADRESGVLSNERIADEWIRMQVEKAVVGQTYEDVIRGTKGNQTLIGTIVDAIKAFVTRLRQRFVDYPSAETAAAISHASRTLRKINENKPTNINANPYAEDSDIRYSVGVIESIDKDYLAAVAALDLQKAQQLVDAAAQTFGAEPYYRGGETFVVADTRKPYVWMAKDRDYAKNYGAVKKYFALTKNALDLTEFGTDQIFRMTRADIAKMFAAKGVNINQDDIDISKLGGGEPLFRALTTDRSGRIKKAITDAGYDAIKFYETRGIEAPPAKEVIAVFNPSQIKSADAITRDDIGNIILLSKRFQVEKDDIRYSIAFRNEENIYAEGRFGDTENFFASLDGSPVGDQVSYSIPVLSSNAGKVDALNDRLKLYNLPSQLRDVLNLRSGTVNQIAASSKALVKYFPKYRDLALKGGVSMDEIKLLFGTTAPPLTDSDLKGIADKTLIFEATIPVTETEGRKADLVAEYSEKLKRERRLRFNDAFVKLQQAAEQNITDAGFGQLVNEAVAFRKDINKFKGLTGFDESDDVYLTRAYKFFNTEGWSMAAKMGGVIKIEGKDVDFGKLRDAAAAAYYEEAEAEFQKIGKPYTDKDVTDLTLKKLDNYLSTLETMTSAVDARVVESIRKDLNRFKPKKDIDSTFRELLGEIDDPLANAVNTLYRVGMLSANEKFRTDFAKTAIDLGLASKEPKAGWITSFAASSAPRTGDLAGLYFEPKVAGVLSEVIGANTKGLNAHSTNLMNGLGRAAMGVSGVAIQMKTQFGVGYWPRNAIGGYVLSAAQGIFMNPFSAKGKQARTESWRASFASLPTEQAQRESILRLIQLNVLNDQSQGRVAQDLLRGLIASPEQELQELMSALDEARATKDAGGVFARIQQNGYLKGGLDKALSGYSQVTDKLAALDGAIDGMFKANAYYYELDAIKKHFGSSMATEQQEEAAARKVKLTFAGNSQVIDLVKSFNKTPMAALFLPFARWKSEVFRTMLNTIPLAMEEIGQGGVMARRGAQRLTSFIATLVAAPAVLGTLATTVFRALTGDDEEEERKLTAVELAALRESLPQWQRGHQLNAQILKGGRIQFIDMDFILPHSQLTNLVSIITEGIQTGDGVNASRLASYVTGDLIGTQIAATAIDEILNNADDRGQPIYLETDNAAQKMQRMLGHYAKGALLPSSLVKGSELLREGQTNREEIFWGEVLGSRPKTVTFGDVERRGFRNLKGLLDNSVSIIGGLTSGRFKSDSEIDDVVDRHQDALNETQRRLNRFMRSMVSMGSTETSVYSSAKIYKFSDDTISSAYQGYRIAWRPNDKWNQKTYFNAEQAKEQDPTQKIQSVDRSVNRKAAVNYVNDAYDE